MKLIINCKGCGKTTIIPIETPQNSVNQQIGNIGWTPGTAAPKIATDLWESVALCPDCIKDETVIERLDFAENHDTIVYPPK